MTKVAKFFSAILLVTPALAFTSTASSAIASQSFGNAISKNKECIINLSVSHRATRDSTTIPRMAASIFDFSVADAEGKPMPLSNYKTKPVTLIVNVASA